MSFVLLAYDEEDSIAAAIRDCRAVGRELFSEYEVVVVDDGSRDATRSIVREADEGDVTLVIHERNRGMGASMRDGYRAARMDYMAHLPGDRQVRADVLKRMAPLASPERVVVTEFENAPSGIARAAMSVVFRSLVRSVGGMRINFAGTYLFHRDWLERIDQSDADSDTFLYSFQLLELFRRAGAVFERVEVPTYPREVGQSREATASRIAAMFVEIARARMW